MYPPSFQTSPGKHLNNLNRSNCFAHNTSNTGSSRLLQQHARQAAVAFPLDSTSSQAMSLTISSTLRQRCIESKRCVWSCTSQAWIMRQLTFDTSAISALGGLELMWSRLFTGSSGRRGRTNRPQPFIDQYSNPLRVVNFNHSFCFRRRFGCEPIPSKLRHTFPHLTAISSYAPNNITPFSLKRVYGLKFLMQIGPA